jgi:undecaprenyl pyrophosphate synthase
MAKLALVYGMRMFPLDELERVEEAKVSLKNGKDARVTMHLIEGSREEIEETLRQSVEACLDLYTENLG